MRLVLQLLLAVMTSTIGLGQTAKFNYPLPADNDMEKTTVTFAATPAGDLQADVYRPKQHKEKLPIFLLLNGVGKNLGPVLFRNHPQYAGWGRAATTIGAAGVVMEADEGHPLTSFDQLVSYLRQNSERLGVDPDQIVMFSCSANVRTGMPIITDPKRDYIRGGVVYYGSGEVTTFRRDVPVLVVRAGLDVDFLNRDIDKTATEAMKVNAPWTVINLAGGHHGFDVFDEDSESRAVIGQTLQFVRQILQPEFRAALLARLPIAEANGFDYSENWPAAAAAYERLLAANPKDNFAHWRLAVALAGQGKHQQAIEHFRLALDLGNGNVGWISMAAAKSSMALGDRETALAFLLKLKGITPMVTQMRKEPLFESLHNDPRYIEVANSLNAGN